MAKGITERQWLNLVIIIISALILAFMLLGRFLNVAVDRSDEREIKRLEQPPLITFEKPQLVMIDFGLKKVVLNAENQWIEDNQTEDHNNSHQLNVIIKRWQHLLSTPFVENKWEQAVSPKVRATVLLYFKNKSQPLIIKVEALNSKEQKGDLQITFIATAKTMLVHDLAFSELVYMVAQ